MLVRTANVIVVKRLFVIQQWGTIEIALVRDCRCCSFFFFYCFCFCFWGNFLVISTCVRLELLICGNLCNEISCELLFAVMKKRRRRRLLIWLCVVRNLTIVLLLLLALLNATVEIGDLTRLKQQQQLLLIQLKLPASMWLRPVFGANLLNARASCNEQSCASSKSLLWACRLSCSRLLLLHYMVETHVGTNWGS